MILDSTGLKSKKKRRRRFLAWAIFFCILTACYFDLPGGFQVLAAQEQMSGNSVSATDNTLPETEKESVADNMIENTAGLPEEVEVKRPEQISMRTEINLFGVLETEQQNMEEQQSEEEQHNQAGTQSQDEAMWQDQNGEWQHGSFTEAIANVESQGTVVVMTNISLTNAITISKSVVLTSYDSQNPCTIRNLSKDTDDKKDLGRIFTITSGELRLQNIILDGGRNEGTTAYHPLICIVGQNVQNTILRMLSGAVLQNAENVSESICGGGINLRRGQFFMYEGSEIRHCKARDGGGIEVNCNATSYSQAMFGMAGGRITDCEANNGGGVYMNAGMFQMAGGEIIGNRSTGSYTEAGQRNGGGGIYVAGANGNKIAALLIQNGKVTDNEAVSNGGGIMLQGTHTSLEMAGGTVEGNTANCGGGVAVIHGNLKLYGGTVTNNNAVVYGGGVLGNPYALIELQGSPKVFDNTAGDTVDHFDNLYLDGAEDDEPSFATSPIQLTGALTDGVQLGMSRWVRPNAGNHPYREMIVSGGAYTISQSDIDRLCDDGQSDHKELYADNMEKYAFIPYDGKIVMVLTVNITLDRNKLFLENEGDTAALTETVTPDNAPIKEVTWSSSDENVATVNANGVVTAVSEGQAVITATTVSPYHATASCTVTVGEEEEKPTDPEPTDKPSDPKPPQKPDEPTAPKPSQTPDRPEENNKENPSKENESIKTATQITLSDYGDSYAENTRMSQNVQATGNPQTGSFILCLYVAAILLTLCMLMLTLWQIRKKRREREKK